MIGSLWIAVLLPALFMPVVYFLGRTMGKKVSWIALIPLLYTTLYFTSLLGGVADAPVGEYFDWLPGIRFGLYADGLNLPIALTVVVLSAILVIYSNAYMDHSIHEQYHHQENPKAHATYYALYLLYVTSMLGVALSTNLFEFYFFFELMIIPSWALINSYGSGDKEKIALMYLMWSIVGAVLFVTGALSAYALTGSYEISALASLSGQPYAGFIVLMMLLGFTVKMAMFGLHIWLPFAHAEAPTPISALLSPAMIGLAAYAIVRFLLPIQGVIDANFMPLLLWGLTTMIYGGMMVLAQTDIKRLLAYSSMSQMGYLFIGIATAGTTGVTGAMMHYISHGLGKAALFLSVGAIMHQTGIRDIRELGGLADRMPITALAFLIGAMNISGIPPTVGFPSKMMIYMGAFGPGSGAISAEFIFALIGILSTALTVAYMMWTMRRIFYGPLPEHLKEVKEASWLMTVPMMLLCFLSIVLGIYPRPIIDPLMEVVAGLLA
ncbi:MAG: NADH-quinone oxidoreductase subunit M [Candidatus Bathyarchaeota archaeon]|nr:NADH-quinone oxidoreductase subunit M [Candidatus Bathyarchaeota archaeon]